MTKLRGKHSTNSQNSPGPPDESQSSNKKVCTIKILDVGASVSIARRDILNESRKKRKKNWDPLTLLYNKLGIKAPKTKSQRKNSQFIKS